jgi:hypothetical protein
MIAPELFFWSECSEIVWLQAKMSRCEVFHIVENGEWDDWEAEDRNAFGILVVQWQ